MKSRGKVNGAEIREQGMKDEGKAANTGKTKASVRGCIMETLGSGKELTILQKKAWRLLGTVFNFSFFPRDLGFMKNPRNQETEYSVHPALNPHFYPACLCLSVQHIQVQLKS